MYLQMRFHRKVGFFLFRAALIYRQQSYWSLARELLSKTLFVYKLYDAPFVGTFYMTADVRHCRLTCSQSITANPSSLAGLLFSGWFCKNSSMFPVTSTVPATLCKDSVRFANIAG